MIKGYRRTFGFNAGMSAYWFATSYKWFILLFVLIPDKVSQLVPGGEKTAAWGSIVGFGAIWALIGPSIFGRIYEMSNGWLSRRGSWLAVGAGLTAIAVFAIYGSSSLFAIGVAYFLLQVSDDIGTGPYAGLVADTVPEEHRGYANSFLGGFKLSGQIISAIAALVLSAKFPDHPDYIFIGIAGVNVVCALFTVSTIRGLPNAERASERRSFFEDYIEPFKHYDFRAVWLNRFIVAFAYACMTINALHFLQDMLPGYRLFSLDLKEAKMAANVLALTISFMGIFGAVLSSRIADKVGRKKLLTVSALILAVAVLPLAFLRDYTSIWLSLSVFGFGMGIYTSNDWAIASDVLPNPDRAATEMGAWQSSETSVQVVAGLVMGQIVYHLNVWRHGAGYIAMVLIASALFAGSVLAVKAIRGSR